MLRQLLLVAGLLISAQARSCYWSGYSWWDSTADHTCRGGYVMVGQASYHNNHREDRRFNFYCCHYSGMGERYRGLHWWNNWWDRYQSFTCGGGRALKRIYSVHHNRREDRRFRFGCADVYGSRRVTGSCWWSGYVNWWDRNVHYICPGESVLTGQISYHHNGTEDRRFRFRCCRLGVRVNCAMSGWRNYGGCSRSCGGGYQRQRRYITRRAQYGGRGCGSQWRSVRCNTRGCPVHCAMSGWRSGSCSKKCGGGTKRQTRSIARHPRNGGRKCGATARTVRCNTQPCPINGGFGKWSGWGRCSRICGGGVQSRTRVCNNPRPRYGGKYCSGNSRTTRTCNPKHCAYVTNCADVKLVEAKTMATLKGKKKVDDGRLIIYKADRTKLLDEIKDADILLVKLKTLPKSNGKTRMIALVEKMRAKHVKELAALKDRIVRIKARLVDYEKKMSKLGHTKVKCECDTKKRELNPVISRAEQKVKTNDRLIDITKKAIAQLKRGIAMMVAQRTACGAFPPPLSTMMIPMYDKMIQMQQAKIQELLKLIQRLEGATQTWVRKMRDAKKELSLCDAKVKTAAKKLKKLLEEFDMLYIWEETVFGEMQIDEDLDFDAELQDIMTRVEAQTVPIELEIPVEGEQAEEAVQTQTEAAAFPTPVDSEEASVFNVQSALSLAMVAGGLSMFYLGRRASRKDGYEVITQA